MKSLMKRAGWVAASIGLLSQMGCSNGTEIPLAKVAPVTLTPPPPPKAGIPAVHSPDVLPGR